MDGIKDPRVAPMTSVVAVEVAPDLKTCKAYISVLGDEKAQAGYTERTYRAQKAISAGSLHIHSICVTHRRSQFVLDQSIEYGVNMSKKIDEVTKDLRDRRMIKYAVLDADF